MLFNRILKATLSFWRLRVEADIPKEKINQIYSSDKDCKFWAGLLLRNVVYLLSFIAPGYQLASLPRSPQNRHLYHYNNNKTPLRFAWARPVYLSNIWSNSKYREQFLHGKLALCKRHSI